MKLVLILSLFCFKLSGACVRNQGVQTAPERCGEEEQHHIGDLIKDYNTIDKYDACQAICKHEPYCNYVTWDRRNCRLYFSITGRSAETHDTIPKECPRGRDYSSEAPVDRSINDTLTFVDFRVCEASVASYTKANDRLMARLYEEVGKTLPAEANMFWCQACITKSLAMLFYGASGSTLEQLKRNVFVDDYEPLTRFGLKISSELMDGSNNEDVKLTLPTKVFVDEDIKIKDSYSSISREYFKSEPEKTSFLKNTAAKDYINEWIANQTENNLENVLSEDMVPPDSRMVLVSVAYMNAKWTREFENKKRDKFKLLSGARANVTMMSTKGPYRTADLPALNSKALELTYKGSKLAMIFILPNTEQDWAFAESRFHQFLAEPKFEWNPPDQYNIRIPKFNLNTTYNLHGPLKKIGLGSML